MRPVYALLVLATLVSLPASAQGGVPLPDTLLWERVGQTAVPDDYSDVSGVGFCGDSLLVSMEGFPHILRGGGPGHPASAGVWEALGRITSRDIGCVGVAGRSILYIHRVSTVARSRDGGYTAEPVLVNGQGIPVPTPGNALIGYFGSPGYIACRTEDGEAWDCADYVDLGGVYPYPLDFAAARLGGAVPAHRLLANGQGGPAYSDDDGRTWSPSDLMVSHGPYGAGLAVVDGGPLHGTAVAVVQNAASEFHVYQSTDGVLWTDLGPTPTGGDAWRFETQLAALPGGLVVRYGDGPYVWASGDAGHSWRVVFDSGGRPANIQEEVRDVAIGPDGHLYLGVESGTNPPEERGGVYRTTVPVFSVAGEEPPAEAPGGVGVSAHPNPAGSRVEVVVRLAAASKVRVVILDARGREVAVVMDGDAPAGERPVHVETGAWPAGVYMVRATAGAVAATARLVVAR